MTSLANASKREAKENPMIDRVFLADGTDISDELMQPEIDALLDVYGKDEPAGEAIVPFRTVEQAREDARKTLSEWNNYDEAEAKADRHHDAVDHGE